MKFFTYLWYFFYIAFNWSIRLAFFILYYEVKGEKKYRINTTHFSSLRKFTIKSDNVDEATQYQPANYYMLEKCFDELQKYQLKSLVDFGSGKGRVLAVAAYYNFKRIRGVEFAAELCRDAEENIRRIAHLYPDAWFQILNMDAVDYEIAEDDEVFFFFNPFSEKIMSKVLSNLLNSLSKTPRKVFVVYVNPLYKKLFTENGFHEIYHHKKFHLIEASILTNKLNQLL
ncbi:MAG: hypothetical protein ICV66_13475 [Chitinophagaceae bacterium]|nr:hypothetical protein [Chitinophagaceae bacterium]